MKKKWCLKNTDLENVDHRSQTSKTQTSKTQASKTQASKTQTLKTADLENTDLENVACLPIEKLRPFIKSMGERKFQRAQNYHQDRSKFTDKLSLTEISKMADALRTPLIVSAAFGPGGGGPPTWN